MQVQPQLVLLQKTMLNIEGLGRQLYPQLNLWETAQPILEQWFKRQVSPKQVYLQLKQEWPDLAQQLPHLPGLIHDALQQTANPLPPPRVSKNVPNGKGHWSGLIGLVLVIGAAVLQRIPLLDQVWVAPASVLLGLVGILVLWNRGNR
jgi:ubiquinone biosynthesis protein